jgi:hypothetical protein
MSLYTHWVCFVCRKSFHQLPLIQSRRENVVADHKCPNCHKEMHDMGVYFEPPPSRAKQAWLVMQLLAENGYGFRTEGAKAYVEHFILCSKRPRPRAVQERIECDRKARVDSKLRSRVKWYKTQKKRGG